MTGSRIQLNYDSGQAVYRQIVDQIKVQIASGYLEPGEKLSSIRALAGHLKVNPRTIVKAYGELEREQLVISRQGQGVFVARNRNGMPARARKKAVTDQVRRLLADASAMGASLEEVRRIVDQVARELSLEERDDNE
jgi:GntR family transcriptional regulator